MASETNSNTADDKDATAANIIAADPDRSVWVGANAGTGKTRLLIDRITRLLLAGTRPEKILCLTFTKAAAAEMASRLADRLGSWAIITDDKLDDDLHQLFAMAPPPEAALRARRLFARTLEAPGGLRIRTIHAFCESLLGRFPLEAGIAPHFSVIDERTAAELLTEARDNVLARAFAGDGTLSGAQEHLAALVDEDGFESIIRELSFNRRRLRDMINDHGGIDNLAEATDRVLGLTPGDTTEGIIIAAACADDAFDGDALARAAETLDSGTATDKKRAATIRMWIADHAVRPALLSGDYRSVFLKKDGDPKKDTSLITTKPRQADPVAFDILMGEQERLAAHDNKLRAVRIAAATRSLLIIGARLLETYDALKENRALLDYDDLILSARRLLATREQVSWVHYKLDGGLDHILVDEAQDTSPEQWDVIAALAEEFFAGEGAREQPRTIFAVGDEKQSIFSFQGADPAEFGRMRTYFGERAEAAGKDWRPVELARSYRSTEAILTAVDQVFATPAAAVGLTSSDDAIRHLPNRRGQGGVVEVWPTIAPEPEDEQDPWDAPLDHVAASSPPARLAERIARQISGWLDSGETLQSADRAIVPGDILILVRSRTIFFEEMVRSLKQRNVPVAGTDRMILMDQMAIMDLVALGQFTLLPDDDLTLATVLKGPLFDFNDDDLFALAYERAGSLWHHLRKTAHNDNRFSDAADRLSALMARADKTPPYEYYSAVLDTALLAAGGGRKKILARLGPDAADAIDEFLNLTLEFERDHPPSLQGFLHWLEEGETQIKRDLEHGRGEVRVMTVHGAKGLQANIVFMPDTCTAPKGHKESRLLWHPGSENEIGDQGEVVLWPVVKENVETVCKDLREQVSALREQEYRRLLYVALTRPRDRLYICGYEGKRGRTEGCWYDLVSGALCTEDAEVELATGGTGWRFTSPQTNAPDTRDEAGSEIREKTPVPQWAISLPGPEPTPPKPLAPSRGDNEPAVRSPFDGDDGARFKRGILIHRLLQFLPDLDGQLRADAARTWLARPHHALDPVEREAIVRETMAVMDAPEFAAVFAPGSQAEVPLIGVINATVISGQADRIAVTDNEVLIVDYKTMRPPPLKVSDIAPAYVRQMAAYRAVLARIYPEKTILCAFLWTDGPRLMVIPDERLEACAP